MCRDIAQGQNVTKLIRHQFCNLEGDCSVEFKALFLPSTQDNDDVWTYLFAGICTFLAVILAVIAAVLAVKYIRKKAKRNRLAKEESSARMLSNNSGDTVVAINTNNRINESRQENGNIKQQSTDPEADDTENTEPIVHFREDLTENGNTQNSSDSGITPDSTAIPIHTDSSSGSVTNRNSNHSSDSSSASFDSVPQEESQRSPSRGDIHYDGHPADRENRQQRGVHMPSSEPSGSAQLVTSHTSYHHSNDQDLE